MPRLFRVHCVQSDSKVLYGKIIVDGRIVRHPVLPIRAMHQSHSEDCIQQVLRLAAI